MIRCSTLLFLMAVVSLASTSGPRAYGVRPAELERAFRSPPAEAAPWTFWYWMKGRVSPEGITADLEAMKRAGLAGAYLMPIQGPDTPPAYKPPATQLSPRFWQMVRHAAKEADRLGLKLGVHACDGFAVAGGPWITPELSMQCLVWQRIDFVGGQEVSLEIPQPLHDSNYYRDVAVLAFPSLPGSRESSNQRSPLVTTSDNELHASRLSVADNSDRYRSETPCWIQFEFAEPFTCRSVTITPDGNNYQCQRLSVLASAKGDQFELVQQLTPPRHGWQDEATPVTHAIPATTARIFRFAWTPEGSEPGAEDLDSAKWVAVLKLNSILLGSEPTIGSYRGKSGKLWRMSEWNNSNTTPNEVCVPLQDIVDLSDKLTDDNYLRWNAPAGEWTLLRIGHTSTGSTNATAGGGLGLECDKLNPEAIRLQFDKWYGEFHRQIAEEIGEQATHRLLTTFHVDSWECGGQNWTPGFAQQFRRLRGYDLRRYLPCIAGIPVGSAETSERFLRDMRATIADLTTQAFFGTLRELTHEQGLTFSAECTAPTMPGDAMRHFSLVDVPMGEFWLNSPTHDKPNDMRDAISAAHVYGKRIVQAEAFTELRIRWDEAPSQLKTLGDRQLALGANRMVMHVFTHNPWLDRKPGQTLGGVGLYFQRDQPWLPASRGWMQYYTRCSAVLQQGRPVTDVAVWTGDDFPSRSIPPERLLDTLPGLIGELTIARERERLANLGQPQRERPTGVRASANIVDPANWANPLGGYQYDSINTDALLRWTRVEDGRITLADGAAYDLLVLPGASPMRPAAQRITPKLLEKLAELVEQGGTILCHETLTDSPSLSQQDANTRIASAVGWLEAHPSRFLQGPYLDPTLERFGISPDLTVETQSAGNAQSLAWNHRTGDGWDLYFLSNQLDRELEVTFSVRKKRETVELWDPVTGDICQLRTSRNSEHGTQCSLAFAPGQSLLLVLRDDITGNRMYQSSTPSTHTSLAGRWHVSFQAAVGDSPPDRDVTVLNDLSQSSNTAVKHFAGVTVYETTFTWQPEDDRRTWLEFDELAPLAEVEINNQDCGVVWTAPWRLEVTAALQPGENHLRLRVPSTWKNRLIADASLPEEQRLTWTSAPVRLPDTQLTPYGVIGAVHLISE
ncbi:hypothetical protein NG895_20180 [Aeoliella sp. ICT_H6.2]|uniref:Beta-mannosidase-like galactose-binding domain-containing protein n=1 Tax=Aeoliella straminimaris TaxID=2954799 RepID=A0A9X2FDT7_9BACT|nr:glycosyl hydrolase [Aeoliella straminimaris]MCO6046222.1 hypothetical protein [Aeoliella straminimaris]